MLDANWVADVMSRIGIAVVICAALAALAPSAPSAPSPHFSASGRAATGLRVAPPIAQTRPPPRGAVPPLRGTLPPLITRPMPPLRRADGFFRHHHHDHGRRTFVFVDPFFAPSPYFLPYGYPYYSSFYAFGPAPPALYSPSSSVTTPYFCWVDQIGFTDEDRFAHHLHEVHGVPLEQALSASESVGGRYVFFGY